MWEQTPWPLHVEPWPTKADDTWPGQLGQPVTTPPDITKRLVDKMSGRSLCQLAAEERKNSWVLVSGETDRQTVLDWDTQTDRQSPSASLRSERASRRIPTISDISDHL